ncbi:MAG: hypothetical protein QF918_12640 [Pirellulaceae bacterium]|jgi:hypothetical protein|nr:hypothetical protein [Pirellulaceae bacterium]
MAPRFRFLGKKRGKRRTGSRLVGSVGEAIFFGLLFLLGAVALTSLVTTQVVNPTAAIYRPGLGFWLAVTVLSSFVFIGGAGVILTVLQVGVSAERRSAIVQRATDLDLIQDALPSQKDFPSIPREANLVNSPGVELAYRLPAIRSSAWKLTGMTLLALVATGFAAALVVISLESWFFGEFEWVLLAFAAPYIVCGIWTASYIVREIWWNSRIGPTCVEISDLPLRPGHEYAIFLSQGGRVSLAALKMMLVCEEESTYSQGTDIRTETKVVYEKPVFERESISIEPGVPLEMRESLLIPPNAMHSFQSGHNLLRWKLVVSGQPSARPQFVRNFPVVVYPNVDGF